MAQITTAASGDSDDTGTWTGGVVPVSGDRAVIQAGHTVTVPVGVTWTIGHHPASNDADPAINIAATGQLINNGTINCQGDVLLSNSNTVRSYVQGAGATFNFDFSDTSSPSSQVYRMIQPSQYPGTQPSIQITGTMGAHCTFTTVGGGKGRFEESGVNYYGLIEAEWCDFSNIGSSSFPFMRLALTSDTEDPSSIFTMSDCTLTNCGPITMDGYNLGQRSTFELLRTRFISSAGTTPLSINAYGTKLGSNTARTILGCIFDKTVYLYSPADFLITVNYFANGYVTSESLGTGGYRFENNTVRLTAATGDLAINFGRFEENLVLFDDPSSNPHLVAAGVYANVGTYDIKRNVFKYTGSASDGDCITIGSPSAAVTINIENNIVLPNEAGESTGTLLSALGNANVTLNVVHNTAFLGTGGGCAVGETYAGHAGMLNSFKSNLFWDTSARAYKLFDSGTDNSVSNLVASADADYNGGFNFNAGSNLKGYNNLEFSSGSPGSHDVSGDPLFSDDTVDLGTWDDSYGGGGTIEDALTRLQDDPYNIFSFLNYVRNGFAPTEADYDEAAHDGATIGAVPFAGTSDATTFTFVGPTSGLVSVASSNFTVTPDGTYTGTVTPTAVGGGTFTPTSLSWSASSVPKTFTYTPGSAGVKTISIVNDQALTNPASISYTASLSPATTFTFTGPSGGLIGAPSTNFTVTPTGPYTGTVTPSAGGGGGAFTPTVLTWSNDNSAKTFTYTPTTEGVKTISLTNSGALTNPVPLSYAASAGLATTLTLTGPASGEVGEPSGVFTVTPNANYTGTVTPVAVGGGTFSPNVLTFTSSSAPQIFIYTPATEGGKTISLSNSGSLSNPTPLAYTALPRSATGFTFSGPSTAYVNEASKDFTVIPNGNFSGTITPSAGVGGGTFIPQYLYWNNSEVAKLFTYTPATEGEKTITLASDTDVEVPPSITLLASRRVSCEEVLIEPSTCGTTYPFAPNRSYSQGGPYTCSPHFPALKGNFVVPAANVSIQIVVTDTSPFYVGQGIKIGPAYFQIVDILSSSTLEVRHNGLATVGLSMTATHPSQGCYQYPITPAGSVKLQKLVTVKGYDNSFNVISSAFTITGTNLLVHGNLSPKTIEYNAEVVGTFANSPTRLGIVLPKNIDTTKPFHVPSAEYYDGTNWLPLMSQANSLDASVVALLKTDGTVFASGSNRKIRVSGVYESV